MIMELKFLETILATKESFKFKCRKVDINSFGHRSHNLCDFQWQVSGVILSSNKFISLSNNFSMGPSHTLRSFALLWGKYMDLIDNVNGDSEFILNLIARYGNFSIEKEIKTKIEIGMLPPINIDSDCINYGMATIKDNILNYQEETSRKGIMEDSRIKGFLGLLKTSSYHLGKLYGYGLEKSIRNISIDTIKQKLLKLEETIVYFGKMNSNHKEAINMVRDYLERITIYQTDSLESLAISEYIYKQIKDLDELGNYLYKEILSENGG